MRRLILSLALFLSAFMAFGQEEPKTGWVFTPMPNLSYNSDLGLNLGAFCDFFYYGDGTIYPNFLHHVSATAIWSTKGSWYVHGMFESQALIPGVRFSASATYRDATMNNFYGFNGSYCRFDATRDLNADTRTAYYTNRKRFFRASTSFEGRLGGNWSWMGGAVYRYVKISDFNLSRYDSGNSLYLDYLKHGFIHPDEAEGGHSLEAKAGLTYDSRDIELAPQKGIYAEAYLLGNADLSRWRYNYAQLALHWRHYVPLWKDRIIWAYHLGCQMTLAGDMPFYNLNEIATLNYAYEEYAGLGSRYTVRGYRYTGYTGHGYLWGNFELRITPFRFDLWQQHFAIVLNPFIDLGIINPTYRLDEEIAINNAYFDQYGKELDFFSSMGNHYQPDILCSAGCGIKLHMNTNFIISVDFAKALSQDPRGTFTVSMGTTYVF